MFLGTFEHRIDTRDRISVPAKMREELYSGTTKHPIMTIGFEKCLYIYSRPRWEKFANEVETLQNSHEDARRLERFLFANASECPVDPQGRMLVPKNLREYAQLKDGIFMVGVRHRIEIWDQEEWNRESKKIRETSKGIAEKSVGFSI
ncbi:MAG: division/cell wall cluster transcriptional repressor MraZ [Chlamydiae bacterium]|nr:division/cell wall cluster transcriptional repressor MraZ [Chlamydiota bacterium]MBI3266904.1 division/cell wall cluster transcriptional repressor MraZ [Chlamydiota bacterium]